MVQTSSSMLPLGTKAADFCLTDSVSGNELCLQQLRGKIATLIMFICNHCPFVKHVQAELVNLGREYPPKGINVIAISSNDAINYVEDSPPEMQRLARSLGYTFPYLYDETQEVARLYSAACTPDFLVFDKDLLCVYRGQLDDSRPRNNVPVTGKDLRHALNATLLGKDISPDQKPSVGCNIKWKN